MLAQLWCIPDDEEGCPVQLGQDGYEEGEEGGQGVGQAQHDLSSELLRQGPAEDLHGDVAVEEGSLDPALLGLAPAESGVAIAVHHAGKMQKTNCSLVLVENK